MRKILIIFFCLALITCWKKSYDEKVVKHRVLTYLKKTYKEDFKITYFDYYDSFRAGTCPHRSSYFTIMAAPVKKPDLEFRVYYDDGNVFGRIDTSRFEYIDRDDYITEVWKKELAENLPGLIAIGDWYYSKTEQVSEIKIVRALKKDSIVKIPTFKSLTKRAANTVQVGLNLSVKAKNYEEIIVFFTQAIEQLSVYKFQTLRLSGEFYKSTDRKDEAQNFTMQYSFNFPKPGRKEIKELLDKEKARWLFKDAVFDKAFSYHQKKKYKEALRLYEKLISFYTPYSPRIHLLIESCYNAAAIYTLQKKYSKALTCYNLIIELNKNKNEYIYRTGRSGAGSVYTPELDNELMNGNFTYGKYLHKVKEKRQKVLQLLKQQ